MANNPSLPRIRVCHRSTSEHSVDFSHSNENAKSKLIFMNVDSKYRSFAFSKSNFRIERADSSSDVKGLSFMSSSYDLGKKTKNSTHFIQRSTDRRGMTMFRINIDRSESNFQ